MNDIKRSGLFSSSIITSLVIVATWLLVPGPAWAGPKLEITMSGAVQLLTRNDRGDEIVRYEPRDTVQPQSRMLYTINYRNVGDQAAKTLSLVGAIPANAMFVEVVDAGSGVEVRFSSDGGKKFAFLPFTFVTTDAEGKPMTMDAGPDNFTHLRFTLGTPIEPAASGHVSYLVQIR